MIGKSLRERPELAALPPERALATLTDVLASHARELVEVRAADARMIACVVARADKAGVRLCKALGFRLRPGGTGVFGLLGADATRLLANPTPEQRAWLETPCGPRQTKVLLVSEGGLALLSIEANAGKVELKTGP
jgi:hypothetical protein